jgi:hypothetical protein
MYVQRPDKVLPGLERYCKCLCLDQIEFLIRTTVKIDKQQKVFRFDVCYELSNFFEHKQLIDNGFKADCFAFSLK